MQLFIFAAVLLSGAKLVLLYEFMSNLDTETEERTKTLTEARLSDRTVVEVGTA